MQVLGGCHERQGMCTMNNSFVLSFSTGKDSTLALYRMVQAGRIPQALLVTYNTVQDRSWFHGVTRSLLERFADSLAIPLVLAETDGSDYEACFEQALVQCKTRGLHVCVFGDIDIEAHRIWCQERCAHAGIEAEFPLWRQNREALTREFITAGFKAMIKIVDTDLLSKDFLGKFITDDVVSEIRRMRIVCF